MGALIKRVVLGMVIVLAWAVVAGVPAASGAAQSPWWQLTSGSRPTNLVPEDSGELVATAENVGDANINGAGPTGAAVITDTLPAGVKATGVVGTEPAAGTRTAIPCTLVTQSRVSCELAGTLVPYAEIEVRVTVVVEGTATGGSNEVSVTGGGAPDARAAHPLTIGAEPTPFGVEDYELSNEEAGGTSDVQAGSHPFQQTTTIDLNQSADLASLSKAPLVRPIGSPKDMSFTWPAGMIGNATQIPQCTTAQFFVTVDGGLENNCPPQTAVGVISLTVYEPSTVGFATYTLPLFNLEPSVGEPARFGVYAIEANSPAFIDTAVRTGSDYGVTVNIDNITQTAAFVSGKITLWGVPGDPRHDRQRGWGCLLEARGYEHAPCAAAAEQHPPPLLSLPTSCPIDLLTGEPESLLSTLAGDPWNQAEPGSLVPLAQAMMPGLIGCGALRFNPELGVSTDEHETSKPTGLTIGLHVPQEADDDPEALETSSLQGLNLTLPAGVTLNPAAADDLRACSESQVGFTGVNSKTRTDEFTPTLPEPLEPGSNFCPEASKLGTVEIKSPLLPNPLAGAIYLATQNANPFGSLIALYLVAEDPVSRTLVKLAGSVSLNQDTGQVTVSFQNTPQLPLEDIELHFLSGERALLATPARCGRYLTNASLVPWSSETPVSSNSSFEIGTGPNGSPCTYPGQALPFAPSLTGGTLNELAGAFSSFTATISREDGQQALGSFELRLPPGLSGMLAHVPLCPEVQANAGTCPSTSLIGETTVSAGLGGDPYTLTGGRVYLTGGYAGAPFGLSIEVPVKAGPLDLENAPENHPACDCLVIRAKIEVDPTTAQLRIVSGAIPGIIDGVPLQIKHLNVTIDREGFIFNPTSCDKMSITSAVTSAEGAVAIPWTRFHAASCDSLKFKPKLTVSTSGKTSMAAGASLHIELAPPAEGPRQIEANIAKLKVDLPRTLPSRLTTLQQACLASTFESNPVACPGESKVGMATIHTPVLPVALTGPAILVSHGGKTFPSLTLVLQGDGVTIEVPGEIFINKKGITSVTFRTIPDVPITTFDLTLPEGQFSALGTTKKLCKQNLKMPTAITGQNGATIHESTKVSVTGCKKAKKKDHAALRKQRHAKKPSVVAVGRMSR